MSGFDAALDALLTVVASPADLVVHAAPACGGELLMPIFLVRCPDLSAALVKAGSEDELIDILDEIANPEGCTWSVYRGPLFIEFSLPVRFQVKDRGEHAGPMHREDVVVEDVSGLREAEPFEVSLAEGDTGGDMCRAIEKKAFPHVFRARHDGDEEPSDTELRQAVQAELQTLVRASWRREQVRRRKDPQSRLATEMDVPVRLVQRWVEAARGPQPPPKGGASKRKR